MLSFWQAYNTLKHVNKDDTFATTFTNQKNLFMSRLLIIISFLCYCNSLLSQTNTCAVVIDSLKGSYDGTCSNGKAAGFGKAKGTDSYEGNFKNGYPDGYGTYTWKNGNYFTGNWKKGIKEGKGELHMRINNRDSVITGFWKKDVYKGLYETPYVIYNSSSEIGRVQVAKIDNSGGSISITVEDLKSNVGFNNNSSGAGTVMTGYQITRGQFVVKNQSTLGNKDVTIFRSVIFPFRAIFNFGQYLFEIEILEEGNWDVYIPINK
jgi:hypothetical protein